MHGQTNFFDFLSKESLPRESVHGKTLGKITSDLKTLRKITLGDLPGFFLVFLLGRVARTHLT